MGCKEQGREGLIRIDFGQPVMLSIQDKQLVNFKGPENAKGGFFQYFLHLFLAFCIQGDPGTMRFHTHRIVINGSFINQEIDIGTMGRNLLHKSLTHFKLYGYLVFLHAIYKDNLNVGKLQRERKESYADSRESGVRTREIGVGISNEASRVFTIIEIFTFEF